jgi:hypothetical protein
MGVVSTISYNTFPQQSNHVGDKVLVCFHYDIAHCIEGTIVRSDIGEPYRTIIMLSDGRVVLATECHYSLPPKG